MAQSSSDILTLAYRNKSASAGEVTASAVRALWIQAVSSAATAQDAYDAWIDKATAIIVRGRKEQAALARTYYGAMRRIEQPNSPRYTPKPLPEPDEKPIRSSLFYVAFLDGRPPEDLKDYPIREEGLRDERISVISGSVVRQAMNGGRLQIKTALDDDPAQFRGYYRQLGADPCGFCALLGTRHDYGENSFDESDARFEGPGECKVHDECHCTMRPYWMQPALSEDHIMADELWGKVKKQFPGMNNKQLINEYGTQWREIRAARKAGTMNEDRQPEGLSA